MVNQSARKFHKNDFSIICHYNSSDKEANELKEKLNSIRKNSIELIKFDLNDVKNYQSFCSDEVLNKYGKVDVLINNASLLFCHPLSKNNMSDWDDSINSNVKGPLALTKHLVENLKENSGAVINLSDAMVQKGRKITSIYAIAKGGLESLGQISG